MAIIGRQIEQLRPLLKRLITDNQFYSRKLDLAGATGKTRDLEEFSANVPLTSRAELFEDQRNTPPFGTNLTFPIADYARCHLGENVPPGRLRWLDTRESWERMVSLMANAFQIAGLRPDDRLLIVTAPGRSLASWLAIEAAFLNGNLCLIDSGSGARECLETMMETQATVVLGAPADLLAMAEQAASAGLDTSRNHVRLVLAGSSGGGCAPAARSSLARLWPDAQVHGQFASTEAGFFAFECPAKPCAYHVPEQYCVAEVIDPQTGQTLDRGLAGELVLTPLYRTGCPAIRLRTGHSVRVSADKICACGRSTIALEGGVQS